MQFYKANYQSRFLFPDKIVIRIQTNYLTLQNKSAYIKIKQKSDLKNKLTTLNMLLD